jgi:hypothetical protein
VWIQEECAMSVRHPEKYDLGLLKLIKEEIYEYDGVGSPSSYNAVSGDTLLSYELSPDSTA